MTESPRQELDASPAPALRETAETIQPVQTRYAGCHFRSRLEARWAVFFDHLDIEWLYEPERYMVGGMVRRTYLPDFYLATDELWVEVKGAPAALDPRLMDDAADPVTGLPTNPHGIPSGEYGLVVPRILLLGQVPRIAASHGVVCVVSGSIVATTRGIFTCRDGKHRLTLVGVPGPDDSDGRQLEPTSAGLTPCDHVRSAYIAASSARFEHGESGTPRSTDLIPQVNPTYNPTRPIRAKAAKKAAPRKKRSPEVLDTIPVADGVSRGVPVYLGDQIPRARRPGRARHLPPDVPPTS